MPFNWYGSVKKTQKNSLLFILVLEVQLRHVMSCLFWKIGTIRPSAADDSEANRHQTCLHNTLCRIASVAARPGRTICWWERRGDVRDRPLAWRGGDWVSGCNDTLISGKTCQSSWQAEPKLLSATAWSSEKERAGDWLRGCQIKFSTSWGRSGAQTENEEWGENLKSGWFGLIFVLHWKAFSCGDISPAGRTNIDTKW